jgi:hypothetical protein
MKEFYKNKRLIDLTKAARRFSMCKKSRLSFLETAFKSPFHSPLIDDKKVS